MSYNLRLTLTKFGHLSSSYAKIRVEQCWHTGSSRQDQPLHVSGVANPYINPHWWVIDVLKEWWNFKNMIAFIFHRNNHTIMSFFHTHDNRNGAPVHNYFLASNYTQGGRQCCTNNRTHDLRNEWHQLLAFMTMKHTNSVIVKWFLFGVPRVRFRRSKMLEVGSNGLSPSVEISRRYDINEFPS